MNDSKVQWKCSAYLSRNAQQAQVELDAASQLPEENLSFHQESKERAWDMLVAPLLVRHGSSTAATRGASGRMATADLVRRGYRCADQANFGLARSGRFPRSRSECD
eukprot:6190909-Pleurochrysis_carterae.AAC.2